MIEWWKCKGSYKLLRFIAVILSVIIASASFFICAFASDQPPSITWDWSPPHLGLWQEGGLYHYACAITTYHTLLPSNFGDPPIYTLYYYEITCSSPIEPYFITYQYKQFILGTHSSGTYQVTEVWRNGTTHWSTSGSLNSGGGVILAPVNGTAQWVTNGYVCNILDNNTASYSSNFQDSDYYTHTPFVMFTYPSPEQTQYLSSLPAPQWDTHNRYIVINDQLYWISLYIDNLWVNPITGTVSQSNDNLTAVVTGNASDPTDGDLYYNYNVSITYQDKDYYCAQYNGIDYSFEDMCCPALIYTSLGSRLTISFDQLSGIYSSIQDILVDYRIYCSSFDLVSGEYIESVYSAQGQVGNADININISCPDSIESIYCYGVEFQNSQNLPVNLGSVLWSYDLDFASWRLDIASKLDAIYALLSQSSVPSTTAPVDYASLLDPEPTVSGYNAEDAGSLLAGAVSDVNVELGDGMEWGRNQINDFATGVPELFLVLILALAFGLTILILGKKKSDN